MHRQKVKEIEQRLGKILWEAKSTQQKKSKLTIFFKLILLVTIAVIATSPLWFAWDDHPMQAEEPVHYKIKKVSIEYPDGTDPIIMLIPSRSGCATFSHATKSKKEHSI